MVPHSRSTLGCRLTRRDDDPGRDRIAEPQRMADRDRDLPRANGAGIPDFRRGKIVRGDLDYREIAIWVARSNDTGEFAPICQHDVDLLAVADDMLVGDDLAVGAPDHAGTVATAAVDKYRRFPGGPRDLGDLVRKSPGQHVTLDVCLQYGHRWPFPFLTRRKGGKAERRQSPILSVSSPFRRSA